LISWASSTSSGQSDPDLQPAGRPRGHGVRAHAPHESRRERARQPRRPGVPG
jgi:hypothetical protein